MNCITSNQNLLLVAVRVTLRFHPIVNLMPFHHPARSNRRAENKSVLREEVNCCSVLAGSLENGDCYAEALKKVLC